MQADPNVQSIQSLLACPQCHGGLLQRDTVLHCAPCARDYGKTSLGWKLFAATDEQSLKSDDRAWTKWRTAMSGLAKYRETASKNPAKNDGTDEIQLKALLETAMASRKDSAQKVLLDIGCKDGRMGALAPEDWSYIGVDPEPIGNGSASGKRSSVIATALAESLPVADRSVDVILCHSSFDYFVDAAKALTEMHRVLKAGGALVLVVSVVSTEVAHARGANSRAERVFGALRATRSLGLKASSGLLAEAMVGERAHTHYYTRAQVMALLGVKFNLEQVQERAQSTSKILYIYGVKRQRRALKVL